MQKRFSTWYDGPIYQRFVAPQSDRMIAHAEKRKSTRGLDNVEFLCANAPEMYCLLPARFDIVTPVLFLHGIDEDIRRAVADRMCAIGPRSTGLHN